jgi:hypothetical protein
MLNPVSVLDTDFGAYKTPSVIEGTQTANHANSSSPSSASLSNTAAGYTTLGGRWQFAAVGGAATDYALFAYQVPTGYRLRIKGIAISTVNTGAAVATTATILDWSLAVNSTAVSLATTDSDPAYGPRRIALGVQSFVSGAAIGAVANDLWRTFENAPIVQAGRYVHVILQMPVATATGSQVIRGDVMIDAAFEAV